MCLHRKMSIFSRELYRSKIPGISSKSLKKKKKKKRKVGGKAGQPKGKKKRQVVYGLVIIENVMMSIRGYIYSSLYYIHLQNL